MSGKPDTSRAGKKTYQQPVLSTFGQLHAITKGTGPQNGDGGQGMMQPTQSDAALKENIVRVGTHPLGFGLYLFDYRPGHGSGRKFGVMAQEVEKIVPEAVSTGPDGYKRVDYARIGIGLFS